MSGKADRRTILKALATLPLAMSFGPALNYIQKQQERRDIALKLISLPPSVSEAAPSSRTSSSFVKGKSVKLDAKIFESAHVPQHFSVDIGNGKKVEGFGVKLPDGRIVAYPAHCPTRKSPIELKPEHDPADKTAPALVCNDSIFDLKSGAALKGPDQAELRPLKVKNCGQTVCVIIEDKYLPDFTS
jgi:nitrite reductase/ring-hydroxylating ferredoxin subunit